MTPRVLVLVPVAGTQLILLLTNLHMGGTTLAEVLATVTVITLIAPTTAVVGLVVLGYADAAVVARAYDVSDVPVTDPYTDSAKVVSLDIEDVVLGGTSALALVG
jgi:hypothetical protein